MSLCGVVGVEDLLLFARSGGSLYLVSAKFHVEERETCGRKLHAELGRFDTNVNISEISRCWTLVSCRW